MAAVGFFRALLIFHMISHLTPTSCNRKHPGRRSKMIQPVIHPDNNLPHDVQITTLLTKEEKKRFFYTSLMDQGALSVTVIPCTSPVRWSISPPNVTIRDSVITKEMETIHMDGVSKGVYCLEIEALEGNSYIHIYLSTEQGGPQTLQNSNSLKLRLLKRQRRKRLTVKWNPSLVDPQGTDYCLVVSTQQYYNSLCSALPDLQSKKEPKIACVGRKTHYTLSNMQHGQKYYFNVFATNRQSNFTYPLGNGSVIFDSSFKPTTLKDSKPSFANLKRLDGKAVFRYKVGKMSGKRLDLFVLPCGGVVDVEISLKDSTVIRPTRIEGFGNISITDPVQNGRYYIKVFAMNREELKKTNGIEVTLFITSKSSKKIPLPSMPEDHSVVEYESLRTCNSVTIGWLIPPLTEALHYCLVVKEGKIHESEDFRMPNQCGLEHRLRKSTDFVVKYCLEVKHNNEKVKTQKITQLKPGRNYIVQVTVKKMKGKALSYNLLQVSTRKSCKE